MHVCVEKCPLTTRHGAKQRGALRREKRQAAMAAAESRCAAAELCSKELRREDAPEVEAERRLPQ